LELKEKYKREGIKFNPKTGKSNWLKIWRRSNPDPCKLCNEHEICEVNPGCDDYKNRIFEDGCIPLKPHEGCMCELQWLNSIEAGTATIDGVYGADYFYKATERLPANYITKAKARRKGWEQKREI